MFAVTYRMNRWPEGKTDVWYAKDQAQIDWVSACWGNAVVILAVTPA